MSHRGAWSASRSFFICNEKIFTKVNWGHSENYSHKSNLSRYIRLRNFHSFIYYTQKWSLYEPSFHFNFVYIAHSFINSWPLNLKIFTYAIIYNQKKIFFIHVKGGMKDENLPPHWKPTKNSSPHTDTSKSFSFNLKLIFRLIEWAPWETLNISFFFFI